MKTKVFSQQAHEFIVSYLSSIEEASGEAITDACKAAGIVPPDDRNFGPIFKKLSHRGIIEHCGFCIRNKGHRCRGGAIWRLKK